MIDKLQVFKSDKKMAIEPAALPEWIKAPLFEPVFAEIHADFKRTKEFKVAPALSAGENYATVMLRIEAKVELKG